MASCSCHAFDVSKRFQLERIVRLRVLGCYGTYHFADGTDSQLSPNGQHQTQDDDTECDLVRFSAKPAGQELVRHPRTEKQHPHDNEVHRTPVPPDTNRRALSEKRERERNKKHQGGSDRWANYDAIAHRRARSRVSTGKA